LLKGDWDDVFISASQLTDYAMAYLSLRDFRKYKKRYEDFISNKDHKEKTTNKTALEIAKDRYNSDKKYYEKVIELLGGEVPKKELWKGFSRSDIQKFDIFFDHRLIHTGQNPSPLLKDIFFTDLDLRTPDLYFGGEHTSLGSFLSELFIGIEKELVANRPDAVVILGDTNSALSSILAKRFSIPVYHLEAGNRSFDQNVPEEINRRIVDHTSDFNLVYTELARNNLISEGLHPRKIALIGSPLYDFIAAN
jgi:hypothetical protein